MQIVCLKLKLNHHRYPSSLSYLRYICQILLLLFIKSYYIIHAVGLICKLMLCKHIHLNNQIKFYRVNELANLHLDLKYSTLLNICLASLISKCLVSF